MLTPETSPVPLERNVSNSEVGTFLMCKRMYHYAFVLNLAPKVTPNPLARGSLGHYFFEIYGKERLEGKSHGEAYRLAKLVFLEAQKAGDHKIDLIMQTMELCYRYMDFHEGWPQWRILGVEARHDLKLTETLMMPIRYDVYVEDRATGKRLIGDYKFTYDFWSTHDHDINGQMPKYITVMQANGIPVDGGFLEEIRTRPLGKEKASDPKNLWKRTPYFPSAARKASMMRQHVATSLEIERYRNLPDQERADATIPVYNKHGPCKFCSFKDLCNSEIEGKKDLTVDIRTGYTTNTYGYNKTSPELEGLL